MLNKVTIEKFGAVAGITLGVLLTIANSLKTKSLLADIEAKEQDKKEMSV